MKINPIVVDLSHHDERVDFNRVKAAGVVGVIHKSTQGTSYTDPTYAARRGAAVEAGLLWGAFHFCTGSDVKTQCDNFLRVAQPTANTLVAIDFEENNVDPKNSMTLDQLYEFSSLLNDRLGRLPVLYAGSYLKDTLGDTVDHVLGKHRLWWAQYTKGNKSPSIQQSWSSYWLWQYTGDDQGDWTPHRIDGIGNACDINDYDGNEANLRAEWAS